MSDEQKEIPMWYVHVETSAKPPKVTATLRHTDTPGVVHHSLSGSTGESSLRAYADRLNQRGVKPPAAPPVCTVADGWRQPKDIRKV